MRARNLGKGDGLPLTIGHPEEAAGGSLSLGGYHIAHGQAVEATANGLYGPLDCQGIPLVDYDRAFKSRWTIGRSRRRFGLHYTPVTTAQYALGLYEKFLADGDRLWKERFLAQAEWLAEHLTLIRGGFGLWLHTFPQPSYGLEAPWASAMAQGQGISVLLRAYGLTTDQRYLHCAELASAAYSVDVSQGGVASCSKHGEMWFEEYPSDPPSHVLNGFIFALWGLHDLYRVTGGDKAKRHWEAGIETLRLNIWRYDVKGWSRYDLIRSENAARDYHLTHVQQLHVMHSLTGEAEFKKYALRWEESAMKWSPFVLEGKRMISGALRRVGILRRPHVTGAPGHTPSILAAAPQARSRTPG